MNLFSILIADEAEGGTATGILPPAVTGNIDSFKAHHPGLPHRLYDQSAIRDFLATSMEQDVLWAFDELLPYAYKADLARLCLLHEFGGIYADLSVCFHHSWHVLPGKLSVFRDRAVIAPWIVSNTILAAPPRFPALEAAIRMIVANCRSRYRGTSPLCPTGPVLFGKAIAMHCEPGQIHLGKVSNVAGRDNVESLVFVDATDGRLIAYRAKSRAGLSELGLQRGVNDYNDFYYSGAVYANEFPVTLPAASLHNNGQTECSLIDGELVYRCSEATGSAGGNSKVIAFCNPLPFAAGSYTVVLDFSNAVAGSTLSLVVTQIDDKRELCRTTRMIERSGPAALTVQINLPLSRRDVAIGVLAGRATYVSIKELRIHRAPADAPESSWLGRGAVDKGNHAHAYTTACVAQ